MTLSFNNNNSEFIPSLLDVKSALSTHNSISLKQIKNK